MRKAERERIVEAHQIGLGKGDIRPGDVEIGELDVLFGKVDFERRQLEIVRPLYGDLRRVVQWRFGIELVDFFPAQIRLVRTLPEFFNGPVLRVLHRAIGDQVFQGGVGRLILRSQRHGYGEGDHPARAKEAPGNRTQNFAEG